MRKRNHEKEEDFLSLPLIFTLPFVVILIHTYHKFCVLKYGEIWKSKKKIEKNGKKQCHMLMCCEKNIFTWLRWKVTTLNLSSVFTTMCLFRVHKNVCHHYCFLHIAKNIIWSITSASPLIFLDSFHRVSINKSIDSDIHWEIMK